jgi:carbon storage regulator
MLVLTRRAGQVVKIGDDIEVVVVSVRGDQVRLGICAPREVSVVRGELLKQVSEENRAAAQSSRLIGSLPQSKEEAALKQGRSDTDEVSSRARPRSVKPLSVSAAPTTGSLGLP